jgi:S-ribosylhomocysteine lyase
VSREDNVAGNIITTFDIRTCKPNTADVMATGELHAIEHIIATYLRNNAQWEDKVIYFGPMGCSTGFYLILAGRYSSEDILPLVLDCFSFTAEYEGKIPGASAIECGNYLDLDLPAAKARAEKYLSILKNITSDQLVYPN